LIAKRKIRKKEVNKVSEQSLKESINEAKNSALLSKEQAEKLKKLSGMKSYDAKISNNAMAKRVNLFMDMYKQSVLPESALSKIAANKKAGLSDEIAVLLYILSAK